MAEERGGGIVVFDPKGEWQGWPGTITEVSQIDKAVEDNHRVIVYHPPFGDKEKYFSELATWVAARHRVAMEKGWDKLGFHFTFIVDEAVNVSSARWLNDELLALCAENRPEILDIYLTFQSPKDANNLLKSRISDWYIFNTSLPSDLDYLNKEIGVPETDLAQIQQLNDHEYAHFYFDGGRPDVEFIDDPKSWYISFIYSEDRKDEDMPRDENEFEPVSFESESDFWDFVDKKNRRKQAAGDDYKGDRTRRSDRKENSEGRGGGRGESKSKFTVYKKKAS